MKELGIKPFHQGNLNTLILVNNFLIPDFQREFSWNKDDWQDFWDDINNTREKEREHFFGFMTFKKSGDKIAIIEGQQRITCTLIMLIVVRDYLYDLGETKLADKINDKYIFSETNVEANANQFLYPKIVLSGRNDHFFREHLLPMNKTHVKLDLFNNSKYKKEPETNKLLLECYKFFYNNFKEITKESIKNLIAQELLDINNSMLNNLVLISYEVVDDLAAYNIFQTLNDRGLDLALSDLLKIYLFEKAGESHLLEAKNKWDSILDTLDTSRVNIFLRHYWLSSKRIVKEKQLLNEITNEIKTRTQVFKFLDTIKEESDNYDSILNPRNYYGKEDLEIVQRLLELQDISIGQSLPLLLAGKKVFNEENFLKLVEMVTSYIFRYLTIGEKENKFVEGLFSDIAIKLRNSEIKDVQEIKSLLKKREYLNDDLFKQLFIAKDFKSNSVPKYILKKIEHSLKEHETFSKTITLEHIIPRSPDEQWLVYLKRNNMLHEDWVYKIGNMTLILGRANSKMKNSPFDEKRDKYYTTSTLEINESIKKVKKWSTTEIIQRQNFLAEQAVKIWKL